MNANRIAAIVLIFVVTTVGWAILGEVTSIRGTGAYTRLGERSSDESGRSSVKDLWGAPQVQQAPTVWTTHVEKQTTTNAKGKPVVQDVTIKDPVVLSASRITANLTNDPRRKGLMWYSTYRVRFAGEYSFANDSAQAKTFNIRFKFPEGQAAYNNVEITMNGKRVYPGANLSEGIVTPIQLAPKQAAVLKVAYGSQGLDTWHYQFAQDNETTSVRGFDAAITTNCRDIDFPENCLSPTHKELADGGWKLEWKYGDLISGRNVGVSMPQKLQPGPFASRLSTFAPVSLLFFFGVLLIIGTVGNVRLHPMHYLLLAATFFSFHLLFSYLVDHVTPFNAFLISSVVSLFLTVSYLRLVVNWRFAICQAGLWQFVFLVLFTYAFFFEGYTGLTITIGAIVTLGILMQLTGRIDWDKKLAKPEVPVGP